MESTENRGVLHKKAPFQLPNWGKMEHLKLSNRITAIPVVHGSGDFAVEVRRVMLNNSFDMLAIPLPECFRESVEAAISRLPELSVVYQREQKRSSAQRWHPDHWHPDQDDDDDDDSEEPLDLQASYVPIDPCQAVITAIRIAMQEHLPRVYIDPEVPCFEPLSTALPDPYAVKQLRCGQFAAGIIPLMPLTQTPQLRYRTEVMAAELKKIEQNYSSILFLCSFNEWLSIKQAYALNPGSQSDSLKEEPLGPDSPVETAGVDDDTYYFLTGELPYVTGRYEQARCELDDDENLSVDGIRLLLMAARERYRQELGKRARPVTPKLLSTYFRYVRNLALVERRLTPDLYMLVIAAQQIFGDRFAITLAEIAKEYPFPSPANRLKITMGIGQSRLPDGDIVTMKSRLPGHPATWRICSLKTKPPKIEQEKWLKNWNWFSHCSWPPEDDSIERFRTHVKDQALALLGNDLARTEKFSTSLKDGLDIRETLRNWHTGDLYVKEFPPVRGGLDCVIMLFDSPADPRDYSWRITWQAEHHDESTLAFFATPYTDEMVGPGIARARYGGALFLFPPRNVPDIWKDRRFDYVDTLEERLIVAGCSYSDETHIALLSEGPPGGAWKRLAKKYKKKLIHVPLNRFSQQTIENLRNFHVLGGQHVRSYAAHFIRKP